MGNSKAKEQIGYFYLVSVEVSSVAIVMIITQFGTHVTQNFTKAREIFTELAAEGNPAGQMV